MAGLPAPAKEAELLSQLPPNHLSGALPRELLVPGERILYETRPGVWSLYWGRLVFALLYILLWVGVAAAGGPPVVPGAGIFIFPAAIWVGVIYLQGAHRVYALTDQRVIRLSGIRGSDIQDATVDQVLNLYSEAGVVQFDIAPPATGTRFFTRPHPRVLRWDGISDAPRVYTFIEEALAYARRRNQESVANQAAIQRIASSSVTCAYCGGLIDLARLDPSNPRCPQCSAPVELPT